MTTPPIHLFRRLRGTARRGIVIEAVAVLAAAFVAFMLVSFALDRTLRLEQVYRAGMLAVFLVGLWILLQRRWVRPLRVDLNDDELALAVERGERTLEQALISAVQFERVLRTGRDLPESKQLMQSVVDDVHTRVAAVRAGTALDVQRIRKYTGLLVACVAAVVTWGAIDAASLGLWARRNLLMSDVDWPRFSRLSFDMETEGGVLRIAEGNDLTVEVVAGGVIPEQVFVHYHFEDGTRGKEPMAMTGTVDGAEQRFTWLLESVISGATLHATGGDGLTEEIRIQIVKRPALSDLRITQTFPDYMRREPETVTPSEGDLRVPAGVSLRIDGASDKDLTKAFLTFGNDHTQELALEPGRPAFSGSYQPQESGVLTIDVTDRDGLGAGRPPRLFLRVVKDRDPMVDYSTEGIGSMILYKARVPGRLKVRDDFGITTVASKLRIGSGDAKTDDAAPWETVAFTGLRQPAAEDNETDYEAAVEFDLLSRNDPQAPPANNPIAPGMLLQIQFSAKDNFAPGEAHLGESEVLTLRVVTEEKLLEDLNRRQVERRHELEKILEKQIDHKGELEGILSPTASDPRASLARLRLQAIAREQRALGKQVGELARRYRQILDEYENNRVLKPTVVLAQRQAIQIPLEKLAAAGFPDSASEVDDFVQTGNEDVRAVVISSYDSIIRVIQQVIRSMQQLESVAGLIDALRGVLKTESEVKSGAQKALDKADQGKPKEEDKEPKDPKEPK